MGMRSRQTSRMKDNEAERRGRYGEGSETRNLDEMHTKVGWQENTVIQVEGRRGEEREERGKGPIDQGF